MELRSRVEVILALFLGTFAAAGSVLAQYPGSPAKKPVDSADRLRSTAVLEWVGEPGKPSASRIVPIAVWDGERYQAGGLYLAQPEPLAVTEGTEYELQQAGVPQGRFVIFHGGQVDRNWFGYGAWRPLTPKKVAKLTPSKTPPRVVTEANRDKPSLTDKSDKSKTETSSGASSSPDAASVPDGASSKKPASGNKPASDPGASSSTESTPASDQSRQTGASPEDPDPDRPTLHKRSSQNTPAASSAPGGNSDAGSSDAGDSRASGDAKTASDSKRSTEEVDPDRPTLRKSHDKGGVKEAATSERDPERPMLHRGKPTAGDPALEPSKLTGTPAHLQQMAAVSDSARSEEHPFRYQWSNAEDEVKMKAALEEIARKAIAASAARTGLAPAPPAIASAPQVHRRAGSRSGTRASGGQKTAGAAVPTPLTDESFNAYELSYSGGATLILTARSGEGEAEKDVTIVAQPDFYGVPHVLLQSVADASHLDMTPRMHFIDAVDTDGSNRAELIFELRGETDRQFAIYKVTRGRVEQVFATDRLPLGTMRN